VETVSRDPPTPRATTTKSTRVEPDRVGSG
jgi:hypothetical protein